MHDNIVRALSWPGEALEDPITLMGREWLVTNGLGGYASGTVSGAVTRRYHGLLVAALPSPLGRIVMLNHLEERLVLPDGQAIHLTGEESTDRRVNTSGFRYLKEFRLEMGLPVWRYEIGELVLEKRVLLPHLQNTVHISYHVLNGKQPIRLELRPSLHFRPQEAAVNEVFAKEYILTVSDQCYELRGGEDFPPLRMLIYADRATFTIDRRRRRDILFRVEEARGYPSVGEHWSPGAFAMPLEKGKEATLAVSTEALDVITSLNPLQAREAEYQRRQKLLEIANPAVRAGMAAELVLASDQFIITPAGRAEEAARARAVGIEVKTVIAGYHWFTDWGRDTMISLEGLTLITGRHREASHILRTFANYIRDGLIPNMFPEHDKTGLYHTADATLWFFHAIHRYVQTTGDRDLVRDILPKLIDIVEHHLRGTRFNIGIDPKDGLMRQGQEGYQLTWMDAKVNNWVVTPRRGKAVELNALWYNALCLLEQWVREERGSAAAQWLCDCAGQAKHSFNQRFWYEAGGYLYDVIDGEQGDDAACRPNQVFAIALDYPILDSARWKPVLTVVEEELLTPVGLRSLSPKHPDYKPTYTGNLLSRDAAYHQGTVWAWLIGPYIDAWLKLYPENVAGAHQLLHGFEAHLNEEGLGTISEIFDAEAPFTPRGCIAQAWSVAEVLRCWLKTTQ
jgi:predicted glycogen debranching enzyme